MKSIHKLYLFFGLTIIFYLILVFNIPKKIDWFSHFDSRKTSPYGTKALTQLLEDSEYNNTAFFTESVRLTPYEIYDSLNTFHDQNLCIISDRVNIDKPSIETLLDQVSEGKTVFIASEKINRDLLDTLDLEITERFNFKSFEQVLIERDFVVDSTSLTFDHLKGHFSSFEVVHSISEYDSLNTTPLLYNQDNAPVFVKVPFGQGHFFILTVPKILGNISLLHQENYKLIEAIFNQLPQEKYLRTEFYSLGRNHHSSPLRVLLSHDALRYGLYLCLSLLLIYLIFESKREQRAIPIILPPRNESMAFVQTLSQLYLSKNDHANIIKKRKKYLLDYIRNKYHINLHDSNFSENLEVLTFRTGLSEDVLKKLFISIDREIKHSITQNSFVNVNTLIDEFYQKSK